MNIEVFHGGVEESIQAVARQEQDLYSGYYPNIPAGFLTNDIRFAVIFAGQHGRGVEVVSTWQIPKDHLIVVDDNGKSQWFITDWIADVDDVPLPVLRVKHLYSHEEATLAVARGVIQFCHVPRAYYQAHETVDAILARLKSKTE